MNSPTPADFCGKNVCAAIEGTSFIPLLKESECGRKRAAFCQVLMPSKPKDVMGRSLRTERWHYIEWADGKGPEGLREYQAEKNATSIDGLPALTPRGASTGTER